MKIGQDLKNAARKAVCRIYSRAEICSHYFPENHPNIFMRRGMIESIEQDLKRDAEVNITLGPATYQMIREEPEIRDRYEKLMESGTLVGVSLEREQSEKLASDSTYIVQFAADHQQYRIGSRRSLPVSKFYRESVPISDFSMSIGGIGEKRKKKLLL